ncbi:hypothetical protein CFN78_27750 [Amycolatopsis antarctica]|uniref:DUF4232 domain-containing protein n=1 Tax=Amycolatopsis antarctica TaxID=1854586 RepID=A0A263CVK9_9PSEU|nr:DUF4232 domain-containing protein [Amycolatopsis antarctica]OZM69999.1 hypothetical protein CFN78_27750 [Amycolatopsis antarctica]
MNNSFVKRMAIGTTVAAGALAVGMTGIASASAGPVTEGPGEVPPCTAEQLKLTDTAPQPADSNGQYEVTLGFKNISGGTCGLDGLPTVDLVGEAQAPYGERYRLPNVEQGGFIALVPGEAAEVATMTVLTPGEGGVPWTPKTLEVTAPGEDTPHLSAWPADLPVLRQDGATNPGSYVGGIS